MVFAGFRIAFVCQSGGQNVKWEDESRRRIAPPDAGNGALRMISPIGRLLVAKERQDPERRGFFRR
jgi:hypothetical protein